MTQKKDSSVLETAPDQRKLSDIQTRRLSELAKVDAKELAGLTIAEASDRLRWIVDPSLFLFRKICGKVVKKDPVTGVEYPVPFATVNVEDTDCNLISYFPEGWPWGWFFPFFCSREVIATVKTDKCGNFCVWIPRFEIDWILQWRKTRICFPDIFVRPSIGDLLPVDEPKLIPERPFPPRPEPGPDPAPCENLTRIPLSTVEALGGTAARQFAERVARLQAARSFGAPAETLDELADVRAFYGELAPPPPRVRACAGRSRRGCGGEERLGAGRDPRNCR